MKRNRVLAAGIAAAVLFAASVYASPYWELQRLRAAVADHDADAVSAHVDFPALRASVKEQMAAAVGKEMSGADANPVAALGQAMAMALVNPLVDAMVSPAGVIAMMENGKVNMARRRSAGEAERSNGDKPDYSLSYRGWDRVALTSARPDGGSFLFRRDGLWGWKLAGIELVHAGH